MKAVNLFTITALAFSVLGSAAFASGFRCTSKDGYGVKIYNRVVGGTRIPAVLVISHREAGTLVVRKTADIDKTSDGNTIRYAVEGSNALDADQAVVEVLFSEFQGDLGAGETTAGLLTLERNGAETTSTLLCSRYLKSANDEE